MTGRPEADYNPIFEHFVNTGQPDAEKIPGMVAYGLYKTAKREWATDFFARNGRKPDEAELADYIRTWTPTRPDGLRQQAESVFLGFAETVVAANAPQIREDALRGSFSKAVGVSIFAAFLYTLILIGFVVITRIAGVDILSVFTAMAPA